MNFNFKEILKKDYIMFVVCASIYNIISILLYWILVYLGFHYNIANAISYIVGIIIAYFLNIKYVFNDKYNLNNFFKFYGTYLSNLLISLLVMFVLVDVIYVNKYFANVLMLLVNMIYNFSITKLLIVKKKKILILGGSQAQYSAIKAAKLLNLKTVVCDINENPYCRKYADEFYRASTTNYNEINEVIKKTKPNGMTTIASDRPIPLLAKLSKEYSFNSIDEEPAKIATNKELMRKCLKKHGISIPKFRVINDYDDLLNCKGYFDYPIIIKPVDNSGSRGVFKINSDDDLKCGYEYAKSNAITGVLLIEEMMIGPEVSVEAFTYQNITTIIQITDKLTTGAPFFVEMGHSEPSMLDVATQERIKDLVVKTISAIGINNSPSHTEIIVDNGIPKIVEIGARLGGDNITSDLVPLSTGINLMKETIKCALNERIDLKSKYNKGSCIRFIHSREGKVKDIIGLDTVKKMTGFVDSYISISSGSIIEKIHNSSNRVGYIIFDGENALEAINRCNKALKLIEVIYEEDNNQV